MAGRRVEPLSFYIALLGLANNIVYLASLFIMLSLFATISVCGTADAYNIWTFLNESE